MNYSKLFGKNNTCAAFEQNSCHKICFILPALQTGGAERTTLTLATGLRQRGWTVLVASAHGGGAVADEMRAAGLEVHTKLAERRWDPGAVGRLAGLLRAHSIEVAFAINTPFTTAITLPAARVAGVPVSALAVHTMGVYKHRRRRQLVNHLLAAKYDAITALSPIHRRYLATVEGLPSDRIAIVPLGVDNVRFSAAGTTHAAEPGGTVGLFGRLAPEKDHLLFLQVAQRLLAENPNRRFLIVGTGPLESQLQSRAATLGIASQVHFLGERHDIPQLMAQCNVVVLTSHPVVETFPTVFVEALATGRPVVSTDIGAVRDLVKDGEFGFVVPGRSPEALADKIRYLLDHADEARAMGAAGQQYVSRYHTADVMVQETVNLLQMLCQNKAKPERNPSLVPILSGRGR